MVSLVIILLPFEIAVTKIEAHTERTEPVFKKMPQLTSCNGSSDRIYKNCGVCHLANITF